MTTEFWIVFGLFGGCLLQALLFTAWRDCVRRAAMVVEETPPGSTRYAVSLVVPARNAEDTLAPLLQDLHAQDLPKERVEVIVVDDHSSDGTLRIVQGMMRTWPRLRVLPNAGVGKKAAITTGVRHAQHDLIVLTDADARCGASRVRAIVEAMRNDTDLLVLPVRTDGGDGFLGRLQEEEQAALLGMAAGEGLLGRVGMAYGANLAFRRAAFDAVGGYTGDRYASGDDLFLVQRMKRASHRIAFLADRRAMVTVQGEHTWRGFLRQRLRWAGKMRGVRGGMPWIGMLALGLPWCLLAVSLRFGPDDLLHAYGVEHLMLLLGAWLLWSVPAIVLVQEVRRYLGQRSLAMVTLCCQVLFSVYAPLIALASFVVRPAWKGRKLHAG